jgi:hypothetical protein
MEKHIIDKLVKFGLITNIGVDASKYENIDDLIAKGVVTIPGAKEKIAELLGGVIDVTPKTIEDENDDNTLVPNPEPGPESQPINEVINEVLDDNSPVIDETPESEPVIDETPETVEPIVDTPADVEPIDETPETVEPEIVVEEANDEVPEATEEPVKKTRKSKKAE